LIQNYFWIWFWGEDELLKISKRKKWPRGVFEFVLVVAGGREGRPTEGEELRDGDSVRAAPGVDGGEGRE